MCPHLLQPELPRRPANALNIEVGQPSPRCNLKRPDHWPEGASALRWLGSGGSPLVFGRCDRACPLTSPAAPQENEP